MTSNPEDKIISEFLESIGPWRDLIVIGGGLRFLSTNFIWQIKN